MCEDERFLATSQTLQWNDNVGAAASITFPQGGITGEEFVEQLVRPLMLAVGYQPRTVADALNEEEYKGVAI